MPIVTCDCVISANVSNNINTPAITKVGHSKNVILAGKYVAVDLNYKNNC